MSGRLYLDHNATTPLRPEAAAAMREAMEAVGNPSSVHGHGRRARQRLEAARAAVAALIGARPDEIVFTSGGTEANALALAGTGRPCLLTSAIEHDSVLAQTGAAARLGVDPDGVLVLEQLDRMLAGADAPALVSIMLANNETGVIQPVAEAARIARRHGALIHTDAVQAAGKMAVDVRALGVDLASLSAHKLGGPAGIGALYVRDGLALRGQIRGGGQESRRRAGTENLIGIAGFGAAAEAAGDLAWTGAVRAIRDRMERGLAAAGARIAGGRADRLANTSCVIMPGVPGETQVMALDLAGLSVSAGAACSSGRVARSHVLAAMAPDGAAAATSIRVSLGRDTPPEAADRLVAAWTALYKRAAARRMPRMPPTTPAGR